MDIRCPYCDAILDVTDDLFGREIDCPGCGSRFVAVPMPDAPPAPPPAPAKPLSRRIIRSVVRVLLGTVLGLALALVVLYLLVTITTDRPKRESVRDHSEYVRVFLGEGSTIEERDTFNELLKLSDKRELNEREIERARTLRAELAIHHPSIALRFSIGPRSISYAY